MKRFLMLLMFILAFTAPSFAFTIQGDKVFENDTKAYLSASPHTIGGSGYVILEVLSKQYTGNVNILFGFNTEASRPRSIDLYNPQTNTATKSYTCTGSGVWPVVNTTTKHFWCYKNITALSGSNVQLLFEHDYDSLNVPAQTAYWNETTTTEWQSIASMFNSISYDFDGKNKWYYATNVPVTAGTTYKARMWLDVGLRANGKYDFAIYPSSYGTNIGQALADGNFYYLDPWFNDSYDTKRARNITSTVSYNNIPLITNISTFELVKQSTCNDYMFSNGSENTQLGHKYLSGCNTTTTWYIVNHDIITANTNSSFYDYYNSSTAVDSSSASLLNLSYRMWLPMVESSDGAMGLKDISQYGNNGTTQGSPGFVNGGIAKFATARNFSSGSYVYVPFASSNNVSSNPFTLEAWFYTYGTSAAVIAGTYQGSPKGYELSIGDTAANKLCFHITDDNAAYDEVCTAGNVVTNMWHYVGVVKGTTNITMYLDGSYAGSFNLDTHGDGDLSSSNQIRIGSRGTGNHFAGMISMVRLSFMTPTSEYFLLQNMTYNTYFGPPIQKSDLLTIVYAAPTLNTSVITPVNFIFVNASITSTGTPDSCVLQWNGANESMTKDATNNFCYKNKTGLADAAYTFKVFGNTTTNATTFTESRTVTTDTTAPVVSITVPANTTYTSTTVDLNFTVTEANPDSCVRELDGTNSSIGCTNQAMAGLAQGLHTVKVFANDTTNKTAVASVSFSVDTVAPTITINDPTNATITSGTISLNFVATDTSGISKCWYTLDLGSNVSLAGCGNTSFSTSQGTHRLRVYANDTSNVTGLSEVNFTAEYAAILNITAYDEQNPTTKVSYFNVTITDNAGIFLTKSATTGTLLLSDLTELPVGTYDITVSSDGWSTRTYYSITTTNSSTTNVTAYLLNLSIATLVQFVAKDTYNNNIQGAKIVVERYINGSWVVIGEEKTVTSGTASMYLRASVTYIANGSYASFTNVTKTFITTDSPIYFIFGTDTIPYYYSWLKGNLLATCALSNASTRSINCTVNDSLDLADSVTLQVVRAVNLSQLTAICSNTDSSPSSGIYEAYCSLGTGNGFYVFRLTALTASGTILLVQGSFEVPIAKADYGLTGLLLAFILFIVVTFIGIWNPPAAIILGIISLGASWILGLIQLSPSGWGGLVGIMLVGIVVMQRLR